MRAFLAVVVLMFCATADADELQLNPHEAHYSVAWSGAGLGDSIISFSRQPEKDCYRDKDNFSLDFDWSTHKVRALKRGVVTERDLPEVAYDRLVLQQVVRLWVIAHAGDEHPQPMDFNMVDDDRITPYRFAIIGHESIETPAGKFDAVRVERIDNPKRSLRSWVAPSLDYTPVKIEQVENGDVKLRMLRQP
jgi:hypothetical protein